MNLLGEAMDFLKGRVQRIIKTYDPSRNEVLVAERMILDGVISAEISELVRTSGETGVDKQYYAVVEKHQGLILTVTLLPTANCYQALETLDSLSRQHYAMIPITVTDNGEVIDLYSGHIISLGSRSMNMDDPVKTVVFGIQPKRVAIRKPRAEVSVEFDGGEDNPNNAVEE